MAWIIYVPKDPAKTGNATKRKVLVKEQRTRYCAPLRPSIGVWLLASIVCAIALAYFVTGVLRS
jgi:hypothetical protein